jgi:tetratricopeptide (TPR) repeat protein
MDLYRLGQYDEAIEFLNRVDRLDPKNPDVQFARGRTFQKMGQFDLAASAYRAADELRPEAKVKALLGYCSGQLPDHERAIAQDNAAIEDGFKTAQVFNNRGYSHLQRRELEDAERDLKKALEFNEDLQAPHFNLALLELKRAFENSEKQWTCQQGIAEITHALRIGPEYADLHYTRALLYARAAAQDKTLRTSALDYLEKAVILGFPPQDIDMVGFEELTQELRFKKLIRSRLPQVEAAPTPRLLDPVRD